MFGFLAHLFDTSGFPPRWQCGDWTPGHGWLHILSDLGVWSAYVAIPCVLGYFTIRRKDVPFRTIFWLFGAFILACGTTHLMEAIIFWWPAYRLAGAIKLFTALVSWGTVLALVPVTPKALAMRGPEELEREIAARKEAEDALQRANAELGRQVEALRASEERFRLLVDGTRDYAIFMLDPTGRVASWNPGAERTKQYRAEEIVGQPFSLFYPAEDVHSGKPERGLRVAAVEGRFEDEGWRLRKDGSRFWASMVLTALRDEGGMLRGFSKITRDMTERKQAEENARRLLEEAAARRAAEEHSAAIWEERERLRVTLHSIGDGVIATDTEGRVTLLNPVAEALTGWGSEEATGQPLPKVFPIVNERTRQEAENPVAKVLREGTVVGLANHTVLIARDGRERPIDDSAAPIKDERGRVVGVVLVFRDNTQRRAAEEKARKNQEILQLVHKIGKIGHWEWNSLTDENKWSPEIESLYGLRPGGFEGGYQGWAKLLHPDDLPKAEADVRHALETGEYFTEFRVIWPDSSVHWLETRAKVFKDGHDKPVRIMGVNMDVTERKRVEEELRRSREELQQRIAQLAEADRRKNEFLATLAHELRNPLAPLRTGLQVLRLTDERAVQERVRQMMERQLEQMVHLIDDLMDVSRISRNKLELRKARVPLVSVVENALETARPLIESKGHALTATLPPEPVYLNADLTRLAQVFWNLLNNSAKYTDPGGRIDLSAQSEGKEVVVTVRDTGIGIPTEALAGLFNLFSQVDHSLERAQGGLGIGLALVKGLVEMHGGTVEARSAGVGQGSEFVVRLPLAEGEWEEKRPPAVEATPVCPRRRILIVDDNRDGAASLGMMLSLLGHDTRTAHDGLEALELAEAFRPEVVLLDIGLPKLNGYDVCRRIREQPWGRGLFIVAVTGWGQEDDRRRSREAGFNQHVVKPLDVTVLEQLLAGMNSVEP
jgi:PAS domain S-box-containing protein